MSGGHFGGAGPRIARAIEGIAEDECVSSEWPQTAAMLSRIACEIRAVEHEMDWYISGDSGDCPDDSLMSSALRRAVAPLPAEPGQPPGHITGRIVRAAAELKAATEERNAWEVAAGAAYTRAVVAWHDRYGWPAGEEQYETLMRRRARDARPEEES